MSIGNRFTRRNLEKTEVEIPNAVGIVGAERMYQPLITPDDPSPILIRNTNLNSNAGLTLTDDGIAIYGKRFSVVTKSTDYGKTFVDTPMPSLSTASPALPRTITHAEILKDGHMIVWTIDSDTGQSRVFKTSDTNLDASTTWSEKLQFKHGLPSIAMYGLSIHNNVILFNEYIKSEGQTGNARHVWLSTDYGDTWKNVFTLPDDSPVQHHTHDCAYDPYTKWLWVVTGDGALYRNSYYSKDYGDTWETLWAAGTAPVQFTNVIARPESVLMSTDSPQEFAVYRYDKATGITTRIYDLLPVNGTKPLLAVGARNIIEEDGTVVTYIPWMSEAKDNRWQVIATPDGYNYYPLYVTPVVGESGFMNVLGLNVDGNLVIQGAGFTGLLKKPAWK